VNETYIYTSSRIAETYKKFHQNMVDSGKSYFMHLKFLMAYKSKRLDKLQCSLPQRCRLKTPSRTNKCILGV